MSKYKKRDKYQQLYEFLKAKESRSESFTVEEIITATGYQEGSVKAYIRNKLNNVYLFLIDDSHYQVSGIASKTPDDFESIMSQKSDLVVSDSESLFTSLRDRSLQAFYTAISVYNNPLHEYRIESFCILLSNAWELLLKARIVQLEGEDKIYKSKGKTISLTEAYRKVFPRSSDPIHKNLETLTEIRDSAVHLLIPDIQHSLSRIFQASIFNFLSKVREYKYPNKYHSDLPGLLSFVTDKQDVPENVIRLKYGTYASGLIKEFIEKNTSRESEVSDMRYSIPIDYKVVLTKSEKEGDLSIRIDKDGEPAILVEKPKDVNKTHPYLQKNVIEAVNQGLDDVGRSQYHLNRYSFRGALEVEKVRRTQSNKFYHLLENPEVHKYSQAFIDLLLHKLSNSDSYLQLCKKALKK